MGLMEIESSLFQDLYSTANSLENIQSKNCHLYHSNELNEWKKILL